MLEIIQNKMDNNAQAHRTTKSKQSLKKQQEQRGIKEYLGEDHFTLPQDLLEEPTGAYRPQGDVVLQVQLQHLSSNCNNKNSTIKNEQTEMRKPITNDLWCKTRVIKEQIKGA